MAVARDVLAAKTVKLGPFVTFANEKVTVQLQPHNNALLIVADIDHVPTNHIKGVVKPLGGTRPISRDALLAGYFL